MSKESAAKTLSLLLQDNFSGRAEVGLTGDDDFHFKVSADGSSWLDAITIDRTTGKLTAGQGFSNQAATRGQLYAAPFDALAHSGLQVNGGMEVSQESGTNSISLTASASFAVTQLLDGARAYTQGTFVANAQQVTDAPPGYWQLAQGHRVDRAKLTRFVRYVASIDADRGLSRRAAGVR